MRCIQGKLKIISEIWNVKVMMFDIWESSMRFAQTCCALSTSLLDGVFLTSTLTILRIHVVGS